MLRSPASHHYDRDTFTYQTERENAIGPSGVTFTVGPDEKATQMTVENLNIHGKAPSNVSRADCCRFQHSRFPL